jgi:hypothetical protein
MQLLKMAVVTLLDASDATPNVLPLRTLNWFGRLIRKTGPQWNRLDAF